MDGGGTCLGELTESQFDSLLPGQTISKRSRRFNLHDSNGLAGLGAVESQLPPLQRRVTFSVGRWKLPNTDNHSIPVAHAVEKRSCPTRRVRRCRRGCRAFPNLEVVVAVARYQLHGLPGGPQSRSEVARLSLELRAFERAMNENDRRVHESDMPLRAERLFDVIGDGEEFSSGGQADRGAGRTGRCTTRLP